MEKRKRQALDENGNGFLSADALPTLYTHAFRKRLGRFVVVLSEKNLDVSARAAFIRRAELKVANIGVQEIFFVDTHLSATEYITTVLEKESAF